MPVYTELTQHGLYNQGDGGQRASESGNGRTHKYNGDGRQSTRHSKRGNGRGEGNAPWLLAAISKIGDGYSHHLAFTPTELGLIVEDHSNFRSSVMLAALNVRRYT